MNFTKRILFFEDCRPVIMRLYEEKAVRRAGLDYWKHVNIKEFDSWDQFRESENPQSDHLYFMTKNAEVTIYEAKFKRNGYLIFGSETRGLPEELLQKI